MADEKYSKEYFQRQGAIGGKKGGSEGGKTAAENMTSREREARAKKASEEAARVRQQRG